MPACKHMLLLTYIHSGFQLVLLSGKQTSYAIKTVGYVGYHYTLGHNRLMASFFAGERVDTQNQSMEEPPLGGQQ